MRKALERCFSGGRFLCCGEQLKRSEVRVTALFQKWRVARWLRSQILFNATYKPLELGKEETEML